MIRVLAYFALFLAILVLIGMFGLAASVVVWLVHAFQEVGVG